MAPPTVIKQVAQPGSRGRPAAPKMPRFLNRASGRMETRQAMKEYRRPAAAKAMGHGPAPRHQPSGPAHAGPPPSENPLEMTPGQIHAYNVKQVGANTQTELGPFKA